MDIQTVIPPINSRLVLGIHDLPPDTELYDAVYADVRRAVNGNEGKYRQEKIDKGGSRCLAEQGTFEDGSGYLTDRERGLLPEPAANDAAYIEQSGGCFLLAGADYGTTFPAPSLPEHGGGDTRLTEFVSASVVPGSEEESLEVSSVHVDPRYFFSSEEFSLSSER